MNRRSPSGNDFLTRLAQRALGTADVIAPRLPSRYAPNAASTLDTHQADSARLRASSSPALLEEAKDRSDAAVSTTQRNEQQTRSAVNLRRTALEHEKPIREGSSEQHHTAPLVPLAHHAKLAEDRLQAHRTTKQREDTLMPRSSARQAQRLSRQHPGQEAERSAAAAPPTTTQGADDTAAAQQLRASAATLTSPLRGENGSEPGRWQPLVPPAQGQTPSDPFAIERQPETNNTAPTVHITIGRVEVRAQLERTAPTTPLPPRAASKPALSLDDYLKRGGGRS